MLNILRDHKNRLCYHVTTHHWVRV